MYSKECLRDIKRYLRRDDASSDLKVLRALGKWKLFQTDLIPILFTSFQKDFDKELIAVCES